MKKLILLLCLIPALLFAGPLQQAHKAVIGAGLTVAGDDLLVSWDCGDTTSSQTQLNTYQEDSGTVTSTGVDFTGTGESGSGHSAYVQLADTCSFACTDGTSIDLDQGEITFDYNRTDSVTSYGVMLSLGSNVADFTLIGYTNITENLQFRYGGERYSWEVPSGVWVIGTWYSIKLTWDPNGSVNPRLWVDGTEVTGGSWNNSGYGSKPTISSPVFHIGNNSTNTYSVGGEFDNFKLYSEIQ